MDKIKKGENRAGEVGFYGMCGNREWRRINGGGGRKQVGGERRRILGREGGTEGKSEQEEDKDRRNERKASEWRIADQTTGEFLGTFLGENTEAGV